jgi:hypothetical protein
MEPSGRTTLGASGPSPQPTQLFTPAELSDWLQVPKQTLYTYTHLWPEDEDRTRVVIEAALRKAVTDARRTDDAQKVMEPPESGGPIASGGCWVRTNVG